MWHFIFRYRICVRYSVASLTIFSSVIHIILIHIVFLMEALIINPTGLDVVHTQPKKMALLQNSFGLKHETEEKTDTDKQMGKHEHNTRQYWSAEQTRAQRTRSLIVTKCYIFTMQTTGMISFSSLISNKAISLTTTTTPFSQ